MTIVTPNFKPPKTKKKRRIRPGMSDEHLKRIRQCQSCISGRTPCDAHHLRIKGERGVGLKATDKWTVPLTREEHQELHRAAPSFAKEMAWFKARGIDCLTLASALWMNGVDVESMKRIIAAHRSGE